MSRSRPVLPYKVLRQDSITSDADGWTLIAEGRPPVHLEDGAPLEIWDAQLKFSLERVFRVRRSLASEVGLNCSEPLFDFVVCASTAGGLARQVLFREQIVGTEGSDIHVRVTPDSRHLAREIQISSGVYLSRDVASADPLAPALVGSRLWESNETIRLEGGAARLPMYVVPFAQAFPGDGIDHAEFHVEISEEAGLEVEAAMAVYLNTNRPEFLEQVRVEGSEAERRLWNGIVRRALTSALLSRMIIDHDPLESETLGTTMARWASQIWPAVSLLRLRDLPEADFSRMEAQIESWLAAADGMRSNGGRK